MTCAALKSRNFFGNSFRFSFCVRSNLQTRYESEWWCHICVCFALYSSHSPIITRDCNLVIFLKYNVLNCFSLCFPLLILVY